MRSKIDAASSAVAPGSNCSACVVASGVDLNSIRAVFGPDSKFGTKGTMFLTPGSALENQALKDLNESKVRADVVLQANPHPILFVLNYLC